MSDPHPWLTVDRNDAPLIVSIPHAGREIREDCRTHLASTMAALRDTDWYVDELYDFAGRVGATVVRTALSRTMVDVNRDPSGAPLYPGQATTELCPTTDFDGNPLYEEAHAPDAAEIAHRLELYYRPYHDALAGEIDRLKNVHRKIVLWDAHSIRSRVPRLFEGELPHLNFGTSNGQSCAPRLSETLESIARTSQLAWVTNGRFKGGYITRRYGNPENGVHAVQLEMAIRAYADENTIAERDGRPAYPSDATLPARALIARFLQACIAFARKDFA